MSTGPPHLLDASRTSWRSTNPPRATAPTRAHTKRSRNTRVHTGAMLDRASVRVEERAMGARADDPLVGADHPLRSESEAPFSPPTRRTVVWLTTG
nr:MAG: hypothetical protein DIU78_02970 [Pseudomonadota bacterium]